MAMVLSHNSGYSLLKNPSVLLKLLVLEYRMYAVSSIDVRHDNVDNLSINQIYFRQGA